MIAALLMTVTAFAQRGDSQRRGGGDQGGRQGGRMRGGNFQMMRGGGGMMSEAMLLGRSDVQKDIKLTADQKTKLDVYEDLDEETGAFIAERIIRLSNPALFQSTKEQEADGKND